jgi:hypothetical protein
MSLYWEIEGSVVAVGLKVVTTDSIDIIACNGGGKGRGWRQSILVWTFCELAKRKPAA